MKKLIPAIFSIALAAVLLSDIAFAQDMTLTNGKTEEDKKLEALIGAKQYILLKGGKFELENSAAYSYYSANQIYLQSFAILDPVFLTLGQFGIETARRHIFTYTLSGRWGITDNFQIDVNAPFIYRHDRISIIGARAGENPERTLDKAGIGDISAGISWQPIAEGPGYPAVLLNASYKSKTGKSPFEIDPREALPTGTGYESAKIGFNLVKSVDPVVVFGGAAYAFNLKETGINKRLTAPDGTTGVLESVDPGDTMSFHMGLAYALSYRFSINFQYQQDYTFTSEVNGRKAPNTTLNSAMFKFGTGWSLSPTTSLNVGIATGLTRDAPDYIVEFRLPIAF
jgi:hypothetical protein